MPDFAKLLNSKSMRWCRPLVRDPDLFHLNRHSVSLAFAIGIFCALIPLPGQMFIALFIALWMHANVPIAVSLIWISNPVTIPPIFYLTYKLGTLLIGHKETAFSISLSWEWFASAGQHILLPLIVGSLLTGLVLAVAGYFLILYLWRWQVIKSWEERKINRQRRAGIIKIHRDEL